MGLANFVKVSCCIFFMGEISTKHKKFLGLLFILFNIKASDSYVHINGRLTAAPYVFKKFWENYNFLCILYVGNCSKT